MCVLYVYVSFLAAVVKKGRGWLVCCYSPLPRHTGMGAVELPRHSGTPNADDVARNQKQRTANTTTEFRSAQRI